MSHQEEAGLADQDEDLDYRFRYARAMRAYFALAAAPHRDGDPAWHWALHDLAEGLAGLCAATFLAPDLERRSTPDWTLVHKEWLGTAALHSGLAENLKERA